jgi:hypothetical protein
MRSAANPARQNAIVRQGATAFIKAAAPTSGVVGGWGLEIGAALSLSKCGRRGADFMFCHDINKVNFGNRRVTEKVIRNPHDELALYSA